MLPNNSLSNFMDRAPSYLVDSGESTQAQSLGRSDLLDHFDSQLCTSMAFASHAASLKRPIPIVHRMSSRTQMQRIATGRIVAPMHHDWRPFARDKREGNAMSFGRSVAWSQLDFAIPIVKTCPLPNPAIQKANVYRNLRPKARNVFWSQMRWGKVSFRHAVLLPGRCVQGTVGADNADRCPILSQKFNDCKNINLRETPRKGMSNGTDRTNG